LALALILAAGRGERLGADAPKALVPLAGRPLLEWSVELMLGLSEEIDRVVIALPPGVKAPVGTIRAGGGEVRSQSMANALAAADQGDPEELVVVHDAARPLTPAELVRRALGMLGANAHLDAVIAAAPVSDTIKRVDEDMVVAETLDRSSLWAVQTPQVFRRGALERALDVPAEILAQASDDAWLVERSGGRVGIASADAVNLKITTPRDLELAELLVARRAEVGLGRRTDGRGQ
jgi:2-C-methyl-D-erythritol 4-phosphate cytidylyltransferase